MWNTVVFGLLAVELLLFLGFVSEWIFRKKVGRSVLLLFGAFVVNVTVYMIPYLYAVIEQGLKCNHIVEVLSCVTDAILSFVGEGESERAGAFVDVAEYYDWAYLGGYVLALMATVNTALQAFGYTLRNRIRLSMALRRETCDIVIGTSKNALRYAKSGAAVIIPEDNIDRDGALRLMEQGYIVMRRSFSKELLASKLLNRFTRYNIICSGKDEENLDHIDTFISYRKNQRSAKKIKLFVEIEGTKAVIIRREIIDKSCCKGDIITFCSNELLARKFTEEHPITEYMPCSFIEEDASIKSDVAIGVIFLGFGPLNREMYRQSVANNQFVAYENGEYRQFSVNYHLFDTAIDRKDWIIDGLKEALEERQTKKESYLPLPSLPYNTQVYDRLPYSKDTLDEVVKIVKRENAFHYVIVDVGDTYKNIEAGTRLRNMLEDAQSYHIFIRSDSAYTEDDAQITYLEGVDDIFNHDIIVNDDLSQIAYKLNEIYTTRKGIQKDPKTVWNETDYFTRYSNLYAALNLRLKLHLLGLDYVDRADEASNKALLEQNYPIKDENEEPVDYFAQSRRNAMMVQEKYRWNAYHLLNEVLPMPIDEIGVKQDDAGRFEPYTKNNPLTKHACITTYKGLEELAEILNKNLCEKTKNRAEAPMVDYYKNNDQLLGSAAVLMDELEKSVVVKKTGNQ